MLEERGQLRVEHTLDQYLPDAPHAAKVTLHQHMNHTSGLWCYLQDPDFPFWGVTDLHHNPAELMECMQNRPLQFTPGSRWRYCNSGYVPLGVLIEKLSGKQLGIFLHDNIFRPLTLPDTYFDVSETHARDRLPKGYDLLSATAHPSVAPNLHASVTCATRAMLSTVDDLLKWRNALNKPLLLTRSSLERIFTPGLGHYGDGWRIDSLTIEGARHRIIWHWGCPSGYHSMIVRLAADDIVIIVLQNMTSPDLDCPERPTALFHHRDAVLSIPFGHFNQIAESVLLD